MMQPDPAAWPWEIVRYFASFDAGQLTSLEFDPFCLKG
jgi:hypothetical protein